MAERRRYERKTKLSVVMAADMVGVVAAAEQSGIPESTIRYWADQPEFAEYRAKARADMEHEVGIVAHLAWQRVAEALRENRLEPRDALFAADKATTLYQLVTGQATERTESKEILNTFDDGEKEALGGWLHDLAKERVNAG